MTACLTDLAEYVRRVPEAAQDVRKHGLVKPGTTHERVRSIASALSGSCRTRSPARLLVPFRSSPSPRTLTSVWLIATVPVSKSTSDQITPRLHPPPVGNPGRSQHRDGRRPGLLLAQDSVALNTDKGVRIDWSENVGDSFASKQIISRCEGRSALSVYAPPGVVKMDLTT